ncbi:MAG: Cof-type HAD-IIB family hydrolase [Tannerella sp.]|jgi:Cof subfamily protein (haloacid dehalogenase superfamily)|nr:Cof-type HAD-IIB family hydrolase [Tannerella sp.]
MIKAIFLDIDGTMVSFKTHCVSGETIKSLREARRNGVKIFVATGRHRTDINNLGDLEFDGYMSLNGAYCWVGNETVFKKSIPQQDVLTFADYIEREPKIPCFFVDAERVTVNMINEDVQKMMELVNFPPRTIVPANEVKNREMFQLTAFFPVERESEIVAMLPGCSSSRWHPTFADITVKGVDKSVGIQKIIEYIGLSKDEVMAIGDGGNDISMIQYAGVGVAMGNGGEEVKLAADYVTATVDEDGVGQALRRFGVI